MKAVRQYLPLDAQIEDVIAALPGHLRNEHFEAPPNFTWERIFQIAVPEPEPDADSRGDIFAYRDRSWVDVIIHSAPGGLVFIAAGYLLAHSNSSGILAVIRDATGATLSAFNLPTPATCKMDCLSGDHQERNFAFAVGGHEPISSDTRLNVVYVAVLTDVLPAYPGGQAPEGAAVDSRAYGGSDPTPSEPIDYAQIRAIMNSEIAAFVALFGSTGVRGGLQEKVMDGLRDAILKENRGNPRAAAYQDALAEFVRDRAYEGCSAALEDASKAPTPPQDVP